MVEVIGLPVFTITHVYIHTIIYVYTHTPCTYDGGTRLKLKGTSNEQTTGVV